MLTLVLDNVRKARNIGAVMRVAAAVEARLILTGHTASEHASGTRFAAVGYDDTVDVMRVPNFEEAVALLRSEGVRLVGTSPRAADVYYTLEMSGPLAIVFGNEVGGLGRRKLALMDNVVRISEHLGRKLAERSVRDRDRRRLTQPGQPGRLCDEELERGGTLRLGKHPITAPQYDLKRVGNITTAEWPQRDDLGIEEPAQDRPDISHATSTDA